MWPFDKWKRKPKPKITGFTDKDGVYKVYLKGKPREETMLMCELLDALEVSRGRQPRHVAFQEKLDDYRARGEPVPAVWLDSSIGTFRDDSNGLPAKYPRWENRG